MKKKLISLAVVVCLLAVAVVGGTLAFFTDEDEVINTFTAGKVDITLDEAQVDEYGVPVDPAARVQANTYKLIPGHTYIKDPTIHVAKGSEPCYLFVTIDNGIENVIKELLLADGWLDGDGYYYYESSVDAREDAMGVTVFSSFAVKDDAVLTGLTGDEEIAVTAYAVQADGFASAQAAWDATFGAPVAP